MDCTDYTPRGDYMVVMICMNMRNTILHTIKLIVAVLIGVEVSYPPNPYKEYLIVGLTILIIIKYNLDKKIIEVWDKWLK